MCFELADQRGPQGGGGAGWPAKRRAGGVQDEGAAAGMAMAAAGPGEVMSEYYQAQELSTMVSALTHVVAGGPWAGAAAPMGSAPEQRPMHGASGYYAHEMGSYRGAPSPELAGTRALTNQPGQTRLLPTTSFARARSRSLALAVFGYSTARRLPAFHFSVLPYYYLLDSESPLLPFFFCLRDVARWQSYATHHSAALFSSRPDKRYTVLYMHPQQQEMAPWHVCETSSRKQTKQTTMCIWGGFLAYSFAIISRLHSTSVVHRICTPYLHRVFNVFFSLAWSSSSRSQKNAFFRASSSSLSNQEQARVVINSIGETTNQIDTRRNA